jgi:hypothetical protein
MFDGEKEIWIAKSLGDWDEALKDHEDAEMFGAGQRTHLNLHLIIARAVPASL